MSLATCSKTSHKMFNFPEFREFLLRVNIPKLLITGKLI